MRPALKQYVETFQALSDRDKHVAAGLSQVVDSDGKFSKEWTEYTDVTRTAVAQCNKCVFWLEGRCLIVDGEIAPEGWCRFWLVPSAEPEEVEAVEKQVIFVVSKTNPIEDARGKYLVGADGKAFQDLYLAPLGLTRDNIDVMNIEEFASTGVQADTIIVALGRVAKVALDDLADFSAPHPNAVRRFGDTGEVTRKMGHVFKRLNEAPPRRVEICKALNDKQIVFGVVLDPHTIDAHGDWVSASVVEDSAHNWLAGSRVIGLEHEGAAKATPVESWLVPYPSKEDHAKAMKNLPHKANRMEFGSDIVHSGAWIVGTKLDDELWARVQSGELNAYSIGGFGRREGLELEAMPEVEFVDMEGGADVEVQRIDGP